MKTTPAEIDALLAFLPLLRAAPGSPYFTWGGNTVDADGVLQMPYVDYADWVSHFFRLAGQDCWTDPGYQPQAAARLIEDDARVATASLEQIRTLLTYCVRGERFCDGHWIALIDEGRLVAILERLQDIAAGAKLR
jgi:hypothetical protein